MTKKRRPITFSLSLLLPLLLLGLVEIISYYTIDPNYPLFFYKGKRDEKSSIIYSKLDPLLGYTFDRSVTPTVIEKEFGTTLDKNWPTQGSYIQFSFQNNSDRPMNIVILGGSATDSNLFHGNWPYQLHLLLKEKNIAHNIYNGAVSGYSSNQELLKIQRDLLQLKDANLIIAFNGINDTLANEDITADYPWVHPYQKFLYSQMAGYSSHLIRPTYFPNAMVVLKSLFSSHKRKLTFGLSTQDYVGRYLFNIQTMQAIARLKEIPFLHVLQPLAWDKSQHSSVYKEENTKQFKIDAQFFYQAASSRLTEKSYNLDKIFKSSKKGDFVDFAHQSEKGNHEVAMFIYEELKKRKILKK